MRCYCLVALLVFLPALPVAAQDFVEDDVEVLRTFSAEGVDGDFGWELDRLPDVDGDQRPDFIIPAPFEGGGEVRVVSGATGEVIHQLSPPEDGAFGFSVADAGDVDGDGLHDIIAGAPNAGSGGRAFVFSGADGQVLHDFSAEAAGDGFGSAVAPAGDVDGDGRADLLIGADGADVDDSLTGRGYVYSGADGSLIRTLDAPISAGFTPRLGSAAALAGDIDGDGVPDHFLGARNGDGGKGSAHVYSGADGTLLFNLTGDSQGSDFGQTFISGGHDANGDGIPDLYVGDFGFGRVRGKAYLFSGADGSRLFAIEGQGAQGVGPGRLTQDINNDGHADLIVGAWRNSDGAPGAGRVNLRSGADGSVLRRITNATEGESFGFDALIAGDVNGDGRLDPLVSATSADRVYLLEGTIDAGPRTMPIQSGLSGAWFDPTHAGEGFLLEILPQEVAVVYWFTYDKDGNQRWLVGNAPIGAEEIHFEELRVTEGGVFGPGFDPDNVVRTPVGSLTLRFSDCSTGTAEYVVNGEPGSQELTRLTGIRGANCPGNGARKALQDGISGSWMDPARNGEGFVVQLRAGEPETAVVYWFSYDDQGNQAWFFNFGDIVDDSIVIDDLLITEGGRFGPDFDPDQVENQVWGELEITFEDCNNAVAEFSSSLEGFGSGSQELARLSRIGGTSCDDAATTSLPADALPLDLQRQ